MAKDVLCDVDTCKYWVEGNKCDANKIFITSHVSEAETVKETDCKTFEKKVH